MNRRAFTLIELLVVISIISLLSSVVLSSLSATKAKSRDTERIQEMKQLQTAMELYRADFNGNYPVGYDSALTSLGDLSVLVPQYISALPQDPFKTGAEAYKYCNRSNGSLSSGCEASPRNDETYAIKFETEATSVFGVAGTYCLTNTKIFQEKGGDGCDQQ